MTTVLLVLLGIVGYIVIGVIVHIAFVKILTNRGLDSFDVGMISSFTSIFWMIGVPFTASVLCICSLVRFVYNLIEDITYKITGN